MRKTNLVLLFLLWIPIPGSAFEPLNTDDAGTVARGSNQIEQYFFKTNTHGGTNTAIVDIITPGEEYFGADNAKAFPFTYTRGISDDLEISMGTTYFATPRGNFSPFSNKVLAIKWRFAEDVDKTWALAVKPIIGLAGTTAQQTHGLSLARTSYGLNLIGSQYWNTLELHLNASYMKSLYNTNYSIGTGPPTNRTNILFFSAAPVWRVCENIKLGIDLGITTNPPNNEQYLTNYALLAAIFSINEDIDLGISYLRSAANMGIVISSSGAYATRSEIGLTWRF